MRVNNVPPNYDCWKVRLAVHSRGFRMPILVLLKTGVRQDAGHRYDSKFAILTFKRPEDAEELLEAGEVPLCDARAVRL